MGALKASGVAGATAAAPGHGVAEQRAALRGTAWQHGSAVLHIVVGAASLDQEAPAHQIPQVAVLVG